MPCVSGTASLPVSWLEQMSDAVTESNTNSVARYHAEPFTPSRLLQYCTTVRRTDSESHFGKPRTRVRGTLTRVYATAGTPRRRNLSRRNRPNEERARLCADMRPEIQKNRAIKKDWLTALNAIRTGEVPRKMAVRKYAVPLPPYGIAVWWMITRLVRKVRRLSRSCCRRDARGFDGAIAG